MDRLTVQYGQDPLETDLLQAQQFAMVGLAKLSETTLGIGTVVDGFTLVPTAPASLSAVLSGGSIYQQENLEATAWSSLPVDTHTIVKQGINLNTTTMTFVAPATAGYAQCTLIQAAYAETDTGAVTRPYFNAASPSVGFNGPGNSGTADNTIRKGYVAIQPKVGIAAPSGSQVVPSPDPGFVGLYYVTLPAGATTVTVGNITLYPGAPFLYAKLGQLPAYVQNDVPIFCVDQGAANAVALNPVPAFQGWVAGQRLKGKMAYAPTGASTISVSGLPARPIVRQSGAALTGGEWAVGDHVTFSVRDADVQITRLTVNDVSTLTQSTTFVTNLAEQIAPFPIILAQFATNGAYTWTAPFTGKVAVEVIGGGTGGSSGTVSGPAGAGGGAGARSIGTVSVTKNTVYNIVVGKGGPGAPSSNNFGTAGASSSFSTLITAPGGMLTTASPANVGSGQYGGAAGTGGSENYPGSAGGDGTYNGLIGGNGGSTSYGNGGRAGVPNGQNGPLPGTGGGGAYAGSSGVTPTTGGSGADGQVTIRAFVTGS